MPVRTHVMTRVCSAYARPRGPAARARTRLRADLQCPARHRRGGPVLRERAVCDRQRGRLDRCFTKPSPSTVRAIARPAKAARSSIGSWARTSPHQRDVAKAQSGPTARPTRAKQQKQKDKRPRDAAAALLQPTGCGPVGRQLGLDGRRGLRLGPDRDRVLIAGMAWLRYRRYSLLACLSGASDEAPPLSRPELRRVYREHVSAVYAFFGYSVQGDRGGSDRLDVRAGDPGLARVRPGTSTRTRVGTHNRAQPAHGPLQAPAPPRHGVHRRAPSAARVLWRPTTGSRSPHPRRVARVARPARSAGAGDPGAALWRRSPRDRDRRTHRSQAANVHQIVSRSLRRLREVASVGFIRTARSAATLSHPA